MAGPVVEAYIGLGSNLGDRLAALQAAVEALDAAPGLRVLALSSVYETVAHVHPGAPEAPLFLNAVAAVESGLSGFELLRRCQQIEAGLGRLRVPGRSWQPRPIDLDLLLYGDARLDDPELTVPHPRLGARRFVLVPLAEIAPDIHVPAPFSATARALLARCRDPLAVRRTVFPLALPDPA